MTCDEKDSRYNNCYDCEKYDECLKMAQDNKDGYEAFCDCIVGHDYNSMEEFWEHYI